MPIEPGDEVKMLGDSQALKWVKNADGTLSITTPKPRGAYAYTFRIAKPGYSAGAERLLGVAGQAAPVKVGATASVEVSLANRGDKAVSAGQLQVTSPFGGTRTLPFAKLEPHARATYKVDVPVAAGTRPGSYPVKLEAVTSSNGTFTATTALKVVGESAPVDLSAVYDHDSIAAADAPNDGTFGNAPVAYPAEEVPAAGEVVYDQLRFTWPSGATGAKNNLNANGQTVPLAPGRYTSLQFLASAGYGPGTGDVTLTYADGSTGAAKLTVADWMTGGDPAVLSTTHRYAWGKLADAVAKVYRYEVPVNPDKDVVSVTIGKPAGQANTATHIFAITAEKA